MKVGQKDQKIRISKSGALGFITVGKGNVKALTPQIEKMKKCATENRGKKGASFKSGMKMCLTG
jgi:hypothetical protein